MCRSTYGKTWGLKPKVIRWLYRTMIVPIITYGSIVWWPRTKLASCKAPLTKLQRTVCLGITGAFRTTPTAAIERYLNISPLHMMVELEARKALHRLVVAGLWDASKPKTSHTKFDSSKDLDRVTSMISDKMQTMFVFERSFKVQIPTIEDWTKGLDPPEQDSLVWYTDGSKMESGTGAGIYAKGYKCSKSLGKMATVFQAEAYAIITCAQENIDRGARGKSIYILSDSQAAIKAMASCKVDSKLILDAIRTLNRLGKHNRVRLMWVPGHKGIHGNEMADELAREGSANDFVGPEPCVGISTSVVKATFKEYADHSQLTYWLSSIGLKHSKKFLGPSFRASLEQGKVFGI